MLPFESLPPSQDEQVEALCAMLADLIASGVGRRPTITMKWRRDMRLLVQRGPTGFAPQALDPSRVAAVLQVTFTAGTWWADKVRDPGFLRKHWARIAAESDRVRMPSAATVDLVGLLRDDAP